MQPNLMQFLVAWMLALALFRWPAAETRKRGKILREPTGVGEGLLIVEGQQFPFSAKDLWKSAVPPKAGMVVEAEFNREGQLIAIHLLAEAQSKGA
jgi:hypothetical protein